MTKAQEIAELQLRVARLTEVLGMLIAWLPQSANAPIRVDEATRLLDLLHGTSHSKIGAKKE